MGLKEIFEHEKDGLLVQEKDPEELADFITSILDDPKFGKQLATNARSKVEKEYSHLSAAQKYESIYNEALSLSK